jgi:hypothetical protein
MKQNKMIPCYAADGRSLGFRTIEAADKLVAGGFVKPSYGRKKELKAIWLCQAEGGNPIETHASAGTPYSFLQGLDSGLHCWNLRRLDPRGNDGTLIRTRPSPLAMLPSLREALGHLLVCGGHGTHFGCSLAAVLREILAVFRRIWRHRVFRRTQLWILRVLCS